MRLKKSVVFNGILLMILISSSCAQSPPTTLTLEKMSFSSPETTAAVNATTKAPLPSATNIPAFTLTPGRALTKTPVPSLPPGIVNEVQVDYFKSIGYRSLEETFTNREVVGSFSSSSHLQNCADASGAPVYDLKLEFHTEVTEDYVQRENLVESGPPVFMWSFGDILEEPIPGEYTSEAGICFDEQYSVPFTPGFDASVKVDKEFFYETGYQEVIVTLIPRQDIQHAGIGFHLDGGQYGANADAVVLDIEPVESRGPYGEQIRVTEDRKDIGISEFPILLNEPYVFSMLLEVSPKGDGVTYRPYTAIA